jgi:hypothetical protein
MSRNEKRKIADYNWVEKAEMILFYYVEQCCGMQTAFAVASLHLFS